MCKYSARFPTSLIFASSSVGRTSLLSHDCYSCSGDKGIRTLDPLLARQVLSQLSYTPIYGRKQLMGFLNLLFTSSSILKFFFISWLSPVGSRGLEPPTSRLSGVRSNQLSYDPFLIWQPPTFPYRLQHSIIGRLRLNLRVRDVNGCFP